MAIAGRIPTMIDFVPAITAEDVTVTVTQTQRVRHGAYGNYGRAAGIPQYKVQLKFGIPADKAEFDLQMDNALTAGEGFVFTYTLGGETYNITDCGLDQDAATSDQDANAERTTSFVGVDRIRVS